MKIDILTLFPNMFEGFLTESIIKRALKDKKCEINIVNIRDFSTYPNKQCDDYVIGGGSGMVLMIEPIYNAINSIKTDDSYIILLTPRGKTYKQEKAKQLLDKKHIILICGHYEGVDERIINYIDEEISIGDYILTGGELPAMVITDSIVRLTPGVINAESLENETFNNEYVDYPVYTKPQEFKTFKVPDVLLSGHHENIKKYRNSESKRLTKLKES